MISKEHVLLTRAAEQFADLSDAEQKLLHAVIAGEVANYSSPNAAENDPQHADTWGASRTIRAKVIRWLCGDPEATSQIDPHGINIDAATIEGQLDLAFMTISVPFALRRCAVKAGVTLVDADTRMLSFSGSVLGGSGGNALRADGAQVRGDVSLDDGFQAEGTVRLAGASITGNLVCRGGMFCHPKGHALDADGVQVGGSTFLDGDFRAEGTVWLAGASIGGELSCRGGTFHHPEEDALSAEKNAISADGAQVRGDVFLDDGFRAEGTVRLVGASITGNLVCRGGMFCHPKGHALDADGVQVGEGAFLDDGFRAEGTVRLVNAHVGSLLDDKGSWPALACGAPERAERHAKH